jgi:uncharacterized protein YdeI (YjbR/CyaY-like superfamily)
MSRTPRLVDAELRVVAEPADFARALDAHPVARTAHDRLSYSRKRSTCSPSNAQRSPRRAYGLIEKALAMLRDQEPSGGRTARARTQGDHP